MPKKPNKKSTPTPEFDSTREQNVLLEEINKNVKSVAEGHSILDRKIDKIGSELTQKIDAAASELNLKVDKIDSELREVKSELNSVTAAVMDNSSAIKALQKGQEEIKHKLDTVTSDHEERIKKLELVK